MKSTRIINAVLGFAAAASFTIMGAATLNASLNKGMELLSDAFGSESDAQNYSVESKKSTGVLLLSAPAFFIIGSLYVVSSVKLDTSCDKNKEYAPRNIEIDD